MTLRRNVIANYFGQGWTALMGIAFVPLYIRALGAEAYGLIGVFAILQAWMGLLDLGLTPTLNREMARLRAGAHTAESIRDLLRSLEAIYAGLALLMIVIVWVSSDRLATGWLHAEHLPADLLSLSIKVMAFVLATRWLEQVYRGALQGMQDQVWLNGTQAVLASLRWGGAYLVVTWGWPSILAFFVWQGLISAATTLVLIHRTYSRLPRAGRGARFDIAALLGVRRFAGGMFAGTVLSFLLTQADKLAISKLLPLDQLGYYMLASTAASGVLQLVTPMNNAVLPRLTELAEAGGSNELDATYQRACEWMAAVIVPISLVLAIFPEAVLRVWSGDARMASQVAPVLSLLTLGMLFNGLMNIPYMLQLAHGWTALSIKINLVAVAIIVPAILWLVPKYGIVAAGACWPVLNAGYLLIGAHLMHRRLLAGRKWMWYRGAIAAPLAAGAAVGLTLSWTLASFFPNLPPLATLCVAVPLLHAGVFASLPDVSHRLLGRFLGKTRPSRA